VQFFLMDGLTVRNGVYGVYHPDYDAHVYRNIEFDNVISEPINRGHDDESVQYGSFTYDNVTLENCQIGRDPLIQLACTSPKSGQTGHFRNLTVRNSTSQHAGVVDLGGGPRNPKLQNGVAYYFYDYLGVGHITKVVSAKFPDMMKDGEYKRLDGFTGTDVRAADVTGVTFPKLLDPVDDLPPATMITSVHHIKGHTVVRGVSQDNGEIVSVMVNARPAKIISQHAGVADWEIYLPPNRNKNLSAAATDRAGNVEKTGHVLQAVKRS
jgi:hypothetical protein